MLGDDNLDDNSSCYSESQELAQKLIETFQKLLIQPPSQAAKQDNLVQELDKLNMNNVEHKQNDKFEFPYQIFVIMMFKENKDLNNWSHFLQMYFKEKQIPNQTILFAKPKNKYVIAKSYLDIHSCKIIFKINNSQDFKLLIQVKQYQDEANQFVCGFLPSFYFDTKINPIPLKINEVHDDYVVVKGEEEIMYIIGQQMQQPESEFLEYKSYKLKLIIKNKNTILKQICSFLNTVSPQQESKHGKIIIGVTQNIETNCHTLSGVRCSQRKADSICKRLNKELAMIKPQLSKDQVQIKVQSCGVISDSKTDIYLIENLKIFEIQIQNQDEKIYYMKQGHYHYRQNNGLKNIPLRLLYEKKKDQLVTEEEFQKALEIRDELEESLKQQLIEKFKKRKSQ